MTPTSSYGTSVRSIGQEIEKVRRLKRKQERKLPRSLEIGIPRTLYYFSYPGLWETFFRDIGMKPIVADPSTQKTVERASLISESEHCLPMKMFDAHLAELFERGVEKLFVPRILSGLKGHIACPKLGALPDTAAAMLGQRDKVLTVDINEDKYPLAVSMEELGQRLGVDKKKIQPAVISAFEVMDENLAKLSSTSAKAEGWILILAHPYNLYDEFFSGPIIRKLKSMDIDVRLVHHDRKEIPHDPIKWDTCSKMYKELRHLDSKLCRGVIQISSFNCGCDSIVGQFYREVLKEKKIPYMSLILDEHMAPAGLETRLEAFVESSRW